MTKTVEIIGKLFFDELNRTGMSEAELGEKIGVGQGTINKYLKSRVKNPDLPTLLKIAQYFKKPIEHFLGMRVDNLKKIIPL